MALGFIRYFATTNDSPIGRVAQSYLVSLLRIAPVRVVSKSGQLEGSWQRFIELILTPMQGSCVSCVCTPPAAWISEMSVPMPAANVGPQGAAESTPAAREIARGTHELYTPPNRTVLRNVLFIAEAPTTDAQQKTAARYEAAIVNSLNIGLEISRRWPERRFDGSVVSTPVVHHHVIREAVLGPAAPSETPRG